MKIKEVKAKIEKEHNMQADLMKLIAYGKVMEDDNKTLKDYTIKEGDFLVVMVSKVTTLLSIKFFNRQNLNQNPKRMLKWKSPLNNSSNNNQVNNRISQFKVSNNNQNPNNNQLNNNSNNPLV